MADVRYEFYIRQSDGTDFSSANEAGAAVRLRESVAAGTDSGEYTGNVAASGECSETGNGLWYINIDSADSGYYRVEWYTTATSAWAAVNGFAPINITLEDMLPLSGGTMTGNLVMGDNDITGVSDITFTDDSVGTIGGIASENLLDKTANEDGITGDWETSGEFNVSTADKLLSNSIIVNPYIFITRDIHSAGKDTADTNGTIFIADGDYEVVSIKEVHETAEATASTCYLQLERLSSTEAEGAGDDIITDNATSGLSLKATAKTIQSATIDGTNKVLADGDRLGYLMSANSTELAGMHITIKLKRI